jgi:signal transduction histidine kinase/ActR/RegA family two-component response regulator
MDHAAAAGTRPASATAPDPMPARELRGLLLLSVGLPLLLFLAAAWYDYGAILAQTRLRVTATTDALAEQAEQVMQTANLALGQILDRTAGLDWTTIDSSPEVHAALVGLTRDLPQLQSAFLVDPRGYNSASSRIFPMPPYDDRDRDYYRAALTGVDRPFISAPFRGQVAGTVAFTVSRPRMVDGKPDGLVAVTLSPDYFEGYYRSVVTDPDSAVVTLVRGDGAILLRWPGTHPVAAQLPTTAPVWRLSRTGDAGIVEGLSPLDQRSRMLAFRRLPDTGLLVAYALDRDAYLGPWFDHLTIFAVFAVLAGLVLFFSTRLAMRRGRQERASLRLLLEETGRRQRAEEALGQAQKMEALGRLSGGVAHDFNNLLTAILGSLELAQRRVEEPRVLRLLQAATHAAQRGAQLTAQMLAFSRKHDVALRPTDVNGALRGMDEMLRRTLGPMIRITYTLQDGLWPAVADAMQLEVAVLNLAVNARDAMPLGGTLSIVTANLPAGIGPVGPADRSRQAGDQVAISVTDTGEGMSETVRAAAFEPFFTTKQVGRGTGLGLSMVYGFARSTGGTAEIDSAPGRGTTVRLFLPRSAVAAEPVPAAAPAPAAPMQALEVLLVDDDAAVRELCAETLRELGHSVTDVPSGQVALQTLRSGRRFDLALVDYAMPLMSGSELAGEITRDWPGLPILFMTGYAEGDALRPWRARGYRVLDKPFDIASLAGALRDAAGDVGSRGGNVVRLRGG